MVQENKNRISNSVNYKLSRYVVESAFQEPDGSTYVLLFNTLNNKILKVSQSSFAKLKSHESAYSIPASLIQKRFVVPQDVDAEEELKVVASENQIDSSENKNLYVVIQPSAYCNFGCHYCGQKHTRKNSPITVQDSTLQMIENSLKNGNYEGLQIGWFGGEPTMASDVIRSMTCRLEILAKKYNVHYSSKMVSNGYQIDDAFIKEFLNSGKISSIEITLDGDKESHDSRRHLKNTGGTFDKILENIKKIVSMTNIKVVIRCNVDPRNTEAAFRLATLLAEQDLEHKVSLYAAPIHSWGNDAHKLALENQEFADWEIRFFDHLYQLGFKVNVLPKRNTVPCLGFNKNAVMVDPFGNLFGCTEESLVPSYEVDSKNIRSCGTVASSKTVSEISGRKYQNFTKEISEGKWPCSTCQVLPLCGGRCPKEWKEGRAACPPFKFNLQERILLHYAIRQDQNSRT